ncbi:MAG: hypothetical protein H6R14_3029 [Proteobacteria bacterium]|nr:hypothetical protein [Pseudomonadota bacterium]
MVRLGAGEAGQEAVVDVDDPAGQRFAELGREDLHVAGEDHGVATHVVENPQHLGVGGRLVVGGHRHVMEGDAMPLHEAAEGIVVRDDAGNLDVEFLGLPAGQQVVEAMLLLGDEHDDAFLDRAVVDLPGHRQRLGYFHPETLAELGEQEGQRTGLDLDAHEITTGQRIRMETRLENPAAIAGDEAGDFGDDADLVGAGRGKREETVAMHLLAIRIELLGV